MRTIKLAGMVALASVSVAVAGCGSSQTPDGPSENPAGCTTKSATKNDDAALLPVPPAQVTVRNAGAGPLPVRAELAKTRQMVTLATTTTSTDATGERAQEVTIPISASINCNDASDLTMDLRNVTSTSPDLVDDIGQVDGTLAGAALAPGLAPISLRIQAKKDVPAQAQAALEQSLLQTLQRSVVVPTEPIGVGAQWTARRTVSAGATLEQITTATLTKRDGPRLTMDFTMDETPTDSVYYLPDGERLTITSYSMSGKGTVVLDTSRGLPVSGKIELAGGRELVGSDPTKPLIQKTGFSARWS